MSSLVGLRLGNYRLVRLLGQRGFAAVYLGERWDHLYRAGDLRLRAWATTPPAQGPRFLGLPAESLWIY